MTPARRATTATSRTTTKAKAKPKKAARRKADPVRHWANYLRALSAGAPALRARRAHRDVRRAGLGAAARPDERADPHDPHPEHRRHERRARVPGPAPRLPVRTAIREIHHPGIGWGGDGLPTEPPPDWTRGRVRAARRADRRHPARRSRRRRRRHASRRRSAHIREQRGDYSLAFLGEHAGARGPRLADPDRRHRQEDRVDRAALLLRDAADAGRSARRAGVEADRPAAAEGEPPTRRTTCSSGCSSRSRCTRPTCSSSTTGASICHAQNPKHDLCPVRDRCRFVDKRAP